MNGRLLLAAELPKRPPLTKYRLTRPQTTTYRTVLKTPGIQLQNQHWICQRCLSICDDYQLPAGFYYCPYCQNYHRVTEKTLIYHQSWQSPFTKREKPLRWEGELSPYQQTISQKLCHQGFQPKTTLIWAVTGAGKTEMIYGLLNQLISEGYRIVYVAPRVDVIKELGERFRSVFPTLHIPCLYAESEDVYSLEPFTVMTLQQLVRFDHCFDVIFIDEVDAYPYTDDPLLKRFVTKALVKGGMKVYLTATLTSELEESLSQMTVYNLPLRYHLQPLPVPVFKWLFQSATYLKYQWIPLVFRRLLKQRKRSVLLFFPNIQQMKRWETLLKSRYLQLRIASVSSMDDHRDEKVRKMHQECYDLLLTTMILERGVTFPNIDIWIMDAHHQIYTKQALIQISGRAGRKKDYPVGNVYWLAEGWTEAMTTALQEIKSQNKEAQQWLGER